MEMNPCAILYLFALKEMGIPFGLENMRVTANSTAYCRICEQFPKTVQQKRSTLKYGGM